MAERNNGYASCDLRRNLRTLGRGGFGNSCRQGRDSERSACGFCNVVRGRDNERHDHGDMYGGQSGCGCGCGRARNDDRGDAYCGQECHALMHQLQQLDFSIQETVLYLDAYPDCCEALAHYRHLIEERAQVAAQYEQSCGPLSAHGNGHRTGWDWVKAPWPWHPEFPGNGLSKSSGKQG